MQIESKMVVGIKYLDKIFRSEGESPLISLLGECGNKCIVLSGKAGSGKSSQIQLLRFLLLQSGSPFFYINLNGERTNAVAFDGIIRQIKEFHKLYHKEILIIFDAHDEMFSGVELKFYVACQELLELSNVKILIATRFAEHDFKMRVEDRFIFAFAELLEIDIDNLKLLVDLSKIGNDNLIELLRTPLFLSLYRQQMDSIAFDTDEMDEVVFFERFIESSIKSENSARKTELLSFLHRIGQYCFNNITGRKNISAIGEETEILYIPTNFRTLFFLETGKNSDSPKCRSNHILFEQYAIAIFLANELLAGQIECFGFSILERMDQAISVNALLRDSLIYAGRIVAIHNRKNEARKRIEEHINSSSHDTKNNLVYFMCGCNEFEINTGIDPMFAGISTNELIQTLGGSSYCKKIWIYNDVKLHNRIAPLRLKIQCLAIGAKVGNLQGLAYLLSQTLSRIEVDPANKYYYSETNCVIAKKDKRLVLGCKNSIVPQDVKIVELEAFDNCQQFGLFNDQDARGMIELPNMVRPRYPLISIRCNGYDDFNYQIVFEQGKCFLQIKKNALDAWKSFYATHSAAELHQQMERRSKEYIKKVNDKFDSVEVKDSYGRHYEVLEKVLRILRGGKVGTLGLRFWSRLYIFCPLYIVLGFIAWYLMKYQFTTGYWHWHCLLCAISMWLVGGYSICTIIVLFIVKKLKKFDYFRWRSINNLLFQKVSEKADFSIPELINSVIQDNKQV